MEMVKHPMEQPAVRVVDMETRYGQLHHVRDGPCFEFGHQLVAAAFAVVAVWVRCGLIVCLVQQLFGLLGRAGEEFVALGQRCGGRCRAIHHFSIEISESTDHRADSIDERISHRKVRHAFQFFGCAGQHQPVFSLMPEVHGVLHPLKPPCLIFLYCSVRCVGLVVAFVTASQIPGLFKTFPRAHLRPPTTNPARCVLHDASSFVGLGLHIFLYLQLRKRGRLVRWAAGFVLELLWLEKRNCIILLMVKSYPMVLLGFCFGVVLRFLPHKQTARVAPLV